MAHLFVTTSEYGLLGETVDELLRDGVAAPQIRVFSMRPERLQGLAVKTARYRSPGANTVFGAAIGAAAGVLVGVLLMLAGFGATPVLALVIAFGIGGALSRLWFGHGLAGELYRLDDAMRHGNAVMVLDVDAARVPPLQHSLSQRHPELLVLGTDPEGTPPFP
jgi:hypothetical protein